MENLLFVVILVLILGVPIWGVVWLVGRRRGSQIKGALWIIGAGLFAGLFILVYTAEDTGNHVLNNDGYDLVYDLLAREQADISPPNVSPGVSDTPSRYVFGRMIGNSMQQYGFYDGASFRVDTQKTCEPGDFCSFVCLVERCRGIYGEATGQVDWTKRLMSITDNCYWFEGNPENWMENGIMVQSFDSRMYGCLKQNEFRMQGVAEPL